MNSCEFLFAVAGERFLDFLAGRQNFLGQPIRGVADCSERFDGSHFGMIGGDDRNLPFTSVKLNDAFDDTVGGLSGSGVKYGQGVGSFLFFASGLAIKD